MTNTDPLGALADAVVAAHDPLERFASAVSAMWNSPADRTGDRGEVRMHAERRPDGTLLRLTDVASGRAVEAVLDTAAVRDLARYLNR